MKDTKSRFEIFTFYDKTGIESHLEKMAEEGWMLERISALRWIYRRIEPKKIHFSVSYYLAISDYEPEPTEEQEAFNDFCEHFGWKLAASTVQMQIFYNENLDPVPIETDPTLEIENIHRSVKKTVLKSYTMLLILSLFMGMMFISSLLRDPIHLLSSAINMFTGVWCIVTLVYSLTELIGYFAWRRSAKKAAEQGIFEKTRGHGKLGVAIGIFMLVSIVLYLISLGDRGMQFFMAVFLLILLAGVLIGNGVKNLLKKRKVKSAVNRALTSAICFFIGFVLIISVNYIVIRGIRDDVFENGQKELPFTVGELLNINDVGYIKTHGIENSILLGQITSSQHPNDGSDSPSMGYTVTEVKLPFLYNFVVDQLYNRYDEWQGYDSVYEYIETDAESWGALKAWELYKDGEPDNAFLVCYEKYILEISADWNFKAEEMIFIRDSIHN